MAGRINKKSPSAMLGSFCVYETSIFKLYYKYIPACFTIGGKLAVHVACVDIVTDEVGL